MSRTKVGEEISVYLPYDVIKEIDRRRGRYVTRSKFILWALHQTLESKENLPTGVILGKSSPAGTGSNTTTNTSSPPATEEGCLVSAR